MKRTATVTNILSNYFPRIFSGFLVSSANVLDTLTLYRGPRFGGKIS